MAIEVEGTSVASSDAGEPTMEQLAALLPDQDAAPGAERMDVPTVEPVEGEESAEPVEGEEPAEADAKADDGALERAEAAAKKAREGSRRYREIVESQRRVQAEAERASRESAENRRRVEEAQRFQESLRKDPYAALKKLGMTDHELAERALREGTPEHEMRTLLEQQQEALKEERQAREHLERRITEERQAVARQRAEANFASLADNEGAYPRLSQLSTSAQLAVAEMALRQISNNGYDVSSLGDDQVAEACEQFLAPKKGKAKAAAKAAPAPKASTTTLTNDVTSARASAPRPWEELSDDEQIAAIAASLPDMS